MHEIWGNPRVSAACCRQEKMWDSEGRSLLMASISRFWQCIMAVSSAAGARGDVTGGVSPDSSPGWGKVDGFSCGLVFIRKKAGICLLIELWPVYRRNASGQAA